MWCEVLRPKSGKGLILWGRPVSVQLAITGEREEMQIELWRLSLVDRMATGVVLPPHLTVAGHEGQSRSLAELIPNSEDKVDLAGYQARFLDVLTEQVSEAIGIAIDQASVKEANGKWRLARPKRRIDKWQLDQDLFRDLEPSAATPLSDFAIAIRERLGERPIANREHAPVALVGWLP
jgi:hypothetical protein